MQVESVLFFETPAQIFVRVFRDLKPRTSPPEVEVCFRKFANANSNIRLQNGKLSVKITDLLQGAPAPVLESLAYILLCKLFRTPVPPTYNHRYRLYLNRQDVRKHIHLVRQERGRKFVSGPKGEVYDLEEVFEALNLKHFHGLMARPELGWSRRPSRTLLGHYDPSHNAIILSSLLDRTEVPRIAVDYVMFHEMLHLKYPVQHKGSRRCVHTPEFKEAERLFPGLAEAKKILRTL